MSQTLAQRRLIAAYARDRDEARTAAGPAGRAPPRPDPPRSEPPPGATDRSGPMSAAAVPVVVTLVRAGARIVEAEPRRVVLRRRDAECVVDGDGRVRWRPGRR